MRNKSNARSQTRSSVVKFLIQFNSDCVKMSRNDKIAKRHVTITGLLLSEREFALLLVTAAATCGIVSCILIILRIHLHTFDLKYKLNSHNRGDELDEELIRVGNSPQQLHEVSTPSIPIWQPHPWHPQPWKPLPWLMLLITGRSCSSGWRRPAE